MSREEREQAGVQTCFILQIIGILKLYARVLWYDIHLGKGEFVTQNSAHDLIKILIDLEKAHIPMDDFGQTLWRLSTVDALPGLDLAREYSSRQKTWFGLHDLSHTIRVAFWVLYLAQISNRLGYPINHDTTVAALYAALIHDLARVDDLPGGQHGRDAARSYRPVLEGHLKPDLLERCLKAVEIHGYKDEPNDLDPVWMTLKDADALDRARLGPPGHWEGCDPTRLRLPVLTENTPVLEACLAISVLLLKFLNPVDSEPGVCARSVDEMARRLVNECNGSDPEIRSAVLLVTDRLMPG